MVATDVFLGIANELVLVRPAHRDAAFTVDHFRHGPPLEVPPRSTRFAGFYAAETFTPSFASASLAASCSAAFFDSPVPTPSCSPSITAAQVKRRSCGGPSTSSTE